MVPGRWDRIWTRLGQLCLFGTDLETFGGLETNIGTRSGQHGNGETLKSALKDQRLTDSKKRRCGDIDAAWREQRCDLFQNFTIDSKGGCQLTYSFTSRSAARFDPPYGFLVEIGLGRERVLRPALGLP